MKSIQLLDNLNQSHLEQIKIILMLENKTLKI